MTDTTQPVPALLAVDSHVHLYNWVDLVPMLDEALASFTDAVRNNKGNAPFSGILIFTEPRERDTFSRLRAQAEAEQPCRLSAEWELRLTAERLSLAAAHVSGAEIYLISGQQVETREGIEVLSIGTEQSLPDRQSLAETLKGIRGRDGYPAISWRIDNRCWGRGKLLDRTITQNGRQPLAISDSGTRPTFLKKVGLFDQARLYDLPIVAGTDPAPSANSGRRAGSYGILMSCPFNSAEPAKALLAALTEKSCERIQYGNLTTPRTFFKDLISQWFS